MSRRRERGPARNEAPHTATRQDRYQGTQRGPVELAAELARLPAELLAAALSLLPAELLTAARLGVDIGHRRAGAVLDAAVAEDFIGGRWHRAPVALHTFTELQVCRWPPIGDRALWVQYGPAGPPRHVGREAAA